MKIEPTIGRRLIRETLWLGVIACLCFSVGEGLRLTPFPICDQGEANVTKLEKIIAVTPTPRWIHGPMDVRTWVLKKDKRQNVDFGSPEFVNNDNLTAYHVSISGNYKPSSILISRFRSVTSDRAPPSLS